MRSSTRTNSSVGNKVVPFFVLNLSDNKSKALFTVPSNVAETLVKHPILCRGATFDLAIDVVSSSQGDSTETGNFGNTFISTEFSSPDPEETARAIAERIAIRQEDPSPGVSNLFGR